MKNNQKNALWLAGLSVATSFLAFLFFTAGSSLSPSVLVSPVLLIFALVPLAGGLGIINRNKEVLIISTLISLALTILGIVSIGFFFVVPSLLLIISTFVYLKDEPEVEVNEKAGRAAFIMAIASLFVAIAGTATEVSFGGSILALAFGLVFYLFPLISPVLGIVGIRNRNKEFLYASCAISLVLGEFKREMVDARLKKIALVLAGVALFVTMATTLYSESVLITYGCYNYQTSPTSGGYTCGDFRPVGYLQPIASLFLTSFIALILSALIYKMGIRKVEPHVEVRENTKEYYILLFLSALVVFRIIAVYMFVHPNSVESQGGYGYYQAPTRQVP